MAGADVLLVEDLEQQRLPARTLAALLETAGLRPRLMSWQPGQSPDGVVALARALEPRLIVLSLLFAHGVDAHLALLAALRREGVSAHCTIAGPLATFCWRELLACPALDSVLRGEAEAGVVALATGLADPTLWQAAPGLAYRAPAPTANPLPPPPDLDRLPFPAHEGEVPACAGYGFATIEASRGCYHNCTFCLPRAFHRAVGGPAYRLRSLESLLDEVEALHRRGVRLFLFDDEQFLPPGRSREARVAELAEALACRQLEIAFTIKCRADDVEPGLFGRLQAMGLLRVYVGVESGHAPTLALLGKGVTPEQNAAALAALDALGIVADLRSLLFHPWSTMESVRAEIDYLERVLPTVPTCFCFRELEVYPGTPVAAQLGVGAKHSARIPVGPRESSGRMLHPYILADPRVELLRRLGRLVFGPTGPHARLQASVTQAWYELLLQRRFQPGDGDPARAARLRRVVAVANARVLAVWREMLAFAEGDDVYDAALVNERAAAYAAHISACCAEAEAHLDSKEAPHA